MYKKHIRIKTVSIGCLALILLVAANYTLSSRTIGKTVNECEKTGHSATIEKGFLNMNWSISCE